MLLVQKSTLSYSKLPAMPILLLGNQMLVKIQLDEWPEQVWKLRIPYRVLLHEDVGWLLAKFIRVYRRWFARGRIEYLSTLSGYRLEPGRSVNILDHCFTRIYSNLSTLLCQKSHGAL